MPRCLPSLLPPRAPSCLPGCPLSLPLPLSLPAFAVGGKDLPGADRDTTKKDTARYQKLRNKVHKLVGRINGRFGTLEHAPIHYLDRQIQFHELVALYFLADVCLISSLREGMSKVAFEFIACQQRNHGVLILSEFIGAAQTLGSGALLVNPFNTDALAKAIHESLHSACKAPPLPHDHLRCPWLPLSPCRPRSHA